MENIKFTPYKNVLVAKEATRAGVGTSDAKCKIDKSFERKLVQVKKKSKPDTTPCCICEKRCCDGPFEDWKECPTCKGWFHESCGPDDTSNGFAGNVLRNLHRYFTVLLDELLTYGHLQVKTLLGRLLCRM